jgi:hypothetical protein
MIDYSLFDLHRGRVFHFVGLFNRYIKVRPESGYFQVPGGSLLVTPEDMNDRSVR